MMQKSGETKHLLEEQKTMQSYPTAMMSKNSIILPPAIYQAIVADYLLPYDLIQLAFVFKDMEKFHIFPETFWARRLERFYGPLLKTLPERKDEESRQIDNMIQTKQYREAYFALQTAKIKATNIQKKSVLKNLQEEKQDDRQHCLGHLLAEVTLLNLQYGRINIISMQRLSKALQYNQTLISLNLSGNQVNNEGIRYLSTALRENQTLLFLYILNAHVNDVGIQTLAEALEQNQTLTYLNLNSNQFGFLGIKSLSKALENNRTLTSLELSGNHVGDYGTLALAKALTKNQMLTSLNLAHNHIKDFGVKCLMKILETHNTLIRVNLSRNEISNVGAQHLAIALEKNKTITTLYLGENQIAYVGAQHLATALEKNKTLMTLSIVNTLIGVFGVARFKKVFEKNQTLTGFYFDGNQAGRAEEEIKTFLKRNIKLRQYCIDLLKCDHQQEAQDLLAQGVNPNGVLIELIQNDDTGLTTIQSLFNIAQNDISRGTIIEAMQHAKEKKHFLIANFLYSVLTSRQTIVEEKVIFDMQEIPGVQAYVRNRYSL